MTADTSIWTRLRKVAGTSVLGDWLPLAGAGAGAALPFLFMKPQAKSDDPEQKKKRKKQVRNRNLLAVLLGAGGGFGTAWGQALVEKLREEGALGDGASSGNRKDRAPHKLLEEEDRPGTANKYMSQQGRGRVLDVKNLLREYYGENVDQELKKANEYAVSARLPWAGKDVTRGGSLKVMEGTLPMAAIPPWRILGEPWLQFPSQESDQDPNRRIFVENPKIMRVNGYVRPDQYNATSRATLGHEAAHAMYGKDGQNLYRIPSEYASIPGEEKAYPELSPIEIIPPAAAINRFLFKTRGRRLESPEEYDTWIRLAESQDRDSFPVEVQRWLNYRNTIQSDPDTGRRSRRLKLMDDTMRHIIPGVVRNVNPFSTPAGTLPA